ncbi:glycosyl-4,4'-diaponeurosporenoate acyltransferase [Mammaliicoccus lentus]|uniref:glycosyl-4,4'-diaponeurosporenoate acyltransferase CrtO family protein n=1 Tax=Mammaliicoccus lentus TaxID=42858 RepID=UPI001072274D|nr:glycosyl-4,4'-diaponeurosporenoate acyltransferase [Mammaliicoccus lentus]MBF0748856.1 glycosyl-4,4'-diaponeurosporenoate acyltransferase [Mammaliicoccus lentus]TFU58459.1 glycosyl-4,4'-diaponeurosporenoate acyltransferase [Mammaliicoccus lentus]
MKRLILSISVYWFVVQMIISTLGNLIDKRYFEKYHFLFKSWPIESEGRLWEKLFKVKSWKKLLPDGHKMNHAIKSKKTIEKLESEQYINDFILETRRAEFIHLLSMLPALVFLKSSRKVKLINIVYAIVSNVPIIIVQRYNRPKLERFYYKKFVERKGEHNE